jgi:hypothetical protein
MKSVPKKSEKTKEKRDDKHVIYFLNWVVRPPSGIAATLTYTVHFIWQSMPSCDFQAHSLPSL